MAKTITWIAVAFAATLAVAKDLKDGVPEPTTTLIRAPSIAEAKMAEPKGTDWEMFRHDRSHSGSTPEHLPPPLRATWRYSTGQPVVSSPAVVDGMVYFGSRDSTLHVVNATTGKVAWKYRTRGWIDSSPTVAGRFVYFSSRDGYIYRLGLSDRRLTWRYRTGGADCSSPALVNGILYSASGFPNTEILALDSGSGRLLWRYQADQPVYSSPALGQAVVYIGANDGKFYALRPQQFATHNRGPTVELEWALQTGGGIYWSSPALSDSLVYLIPGDYDKHIYCVRAADGSVKWSYEVENLKASKTHPGFNQRYAGRIEGLESLKDLDWTFPFVYVSSPTLANGMVYFVSGYPDQCVYALDALTGSFKWSQPIGPTIGLGYSSSPAAANSVIYVGSGSGTIYALDAFTGATVWSFDTGSPIISSPTVAMRRLFVANWAGELYCFQSSIGEPGLASGGGESGQPIELLPKAYGLMPPIPNPFTSAASLTYAIPEPGHPTLSVYDLTGKLVRTLVDEEREAGWHTATWDGSDRYGTAVAGGVYFLRLTAGGYTFTQKAVLVR